MCAEWDGLDPGVVTGRLKDSLCHWNSVYSSMDSDGRPGRTKHLEVSVLITKYAVSPIALAFDRKHEHAIRVIFANT